MNKRITTQENMYKNTFSVLCYHFRICFITIIFLNIKAEPCTSSKTLRRSSRFRNEQTEVKPHKCRVCGKTFQNKFNLYEHEGTHEEEKSYQCKFCDKLYKRRHDLYNHERTHIVPKMHRVKEPYRCKVCGKTFAFKSDLMVHGVVHDDKMPYECSVCGKGYLREERLLAHMQNKGHTSDTVLQTATDKR
ncbi:zinc finger protein 585A-like [Mycetomoellerius zeteki]|uniref:zinc finger protein 585A-like n=1 Tax=Mycetomoellerius zeteki TaxID=64791 RepID=UPI00084EA3A1|nr:PREDICTED: zinc finger protein 585A-like [Trachymyrmex zeteki]